MHKTTTERWIHEQCLGNCPQGSFVVWILVLTGRPYEKVTESFGFHENPYLWGIKGILSKERYISTTVELGAFWILVPDLYPYTVNVHLFKWGSICLCKNVVLGHQNWWFLHVYCTREVHPKINVCLCKIRKDVMTALWFWPRSFFPAPDLFCLKWLKWFFRNLLGNYWILTNLPVTNLHLKSNKSKGIWGASNLPNKMRISMSSIAWCAPIEISSVWTLATSSCE